MLKLRDFLHSPQLDPLIEQLASDGPGLTVVAGLDPRPGVVPVSGDIFLLSGRSAYFSGVARLRFRSLQPPRSPGRR
jgi:hypothetical protein